jgi:hypothetical protein
MPHIIIIASRDIHDDEARVTFDEDVSARLISDKHVAGQLLERLSWGIDDAETIERNAETIEHPLVLA